VCGVLQVGQHHAGIDGDRVCYRIDITHTAHPAQRQHHVLVRRVRRRATREAGVAALWHHGDPGLGAEPHRRCDPGGVGRPDHGSGGAADRAGPVGDVGRQVVRFGEYGAVAERRGELMEQTPRHR
jgi:hypothetical protein